MSHKTKLAIVVALSVCLIPSAELMARGFGGGGRGGASRGGASASRGGASVSRGGASASRGGSSFSRGGASASRGGASFSRGGASASRGGASVSRGGTTASRGGASVSRGGASATRSGAAASRGGTSSAVRGGTSSVTGSRGGSVTVGGAKGVSRGPAGGSAGKAGAVQVEGPGGRTATKGGASGVSRGLGGVSAGQARGGSVSGSRGSISGGQAHAAGRSLSTDAGFSKYKGGVSVSRSGGSAARRTTSVSTSHRTRSVTTTSRRTHGTAVRRDVGVRYTNRGGWYTSGWHAKNPRAWRTAGLSTAAIWTGCNWNSLSSWWGPSYTAEPVYYDYGNTIVYEGDTVYNGTEPVGTAEEYYTEASEIASAGDVEVAEEEDWTSLGVWAMVQGDQTESTNIIQLAVNKKGAIRGNHYNATTEATQQIQGSVDQKTQRAAWTIGDNSNVVSETGIANLTQEETEMLIHYGADRTEQWSLVRLEEQEGDA
jgi:hypothetical protein